MPQITLDRWGIKISWTRHNVVTITTLKGHGLSVSDSKSKKTTRIPLIIRLGREDLLRYSQWPRTPDGLALRCLRTLPRLWHPRPKPGWFSIRNGKVRLEVSLPPHDVEVPAGRGRAKGPIVMHVPAYPVTIHLSQAYIEPLREALRRPEVVLAYFHGRLFFPAMTCAVPSNESKKLSPRRPEARILSALLPEATYFAVAAYVVGKDDHQIRQRIGDIMLEDDAKKYLGRFELADGAPLLSDDDISTLDPRVDSMPFITIVYLVDRAFRGAWKHCGFTPPTKGGPPWDFMRRYYYGEKARRPLGAHFGRAAMFRDTDLVASLYIAWWKSLLLGPQGAAAHAFLLLPADKK